MCLAGCLGEATYTDPPDLSASIFDLTPSLVDMARDRGDAGFTCVELNNCEKGCPSDPMPLKCVQDCRARASMSAVMKELALQGCFNQQCPQGTDAGTAAICTPTDMGGFSMACATCIDNSQVAPANMCTPNNAPECHQCYDEAIACLQDK
jgi:hypothetical protein